MCCIADGLNGLQTTLKPYNSAISCTINIILSLNENIFLRIFVLAIRYPETNLQVYIIFLSLSWSNYMNLLLSFYCNRVKYTDGPFTLNDLPFNDL